MAFTDAYIDTPSQFTYDLNGSASINWNNRTLYDGATTQSLSWENRLGYDFIGTESINWGTHRTFDSNQSQSLVWDDRQTFDRNASLSSNWDSRSLHGSWTVDTTGSDRGSIVTVGQFNDTTSSFGGSLPLIASDTSVPIVTSYNTATLIGVDAYNDPYLASPAGPTIGFDSSNIPMVTAGTNYGCLKITGIGEGTGSEASLAFIPNGVVNGNPNYWVVGTNIGDDAGNGNFDFWNGSNNVVASLTNAGLLTTVSASFGAVSASTFIGSGAQLTGISVTNSTVPTNLSYNASLVIDPSTGNYFKCILDGDVSISFISGGIADGQEINLMLIAAGSGSSLTLAGIQIGTDSTYTNPKALTSFLLYILDFKWSYDAGAWMFESISGGFIGY